MTRSIRGCSGPIRSPELPERAACGRVPLAWKRAGTGAQVKERTACRRRGRKQNGGMCRVCCWRRKLYYPCYVCEGRWSLSEVVERAHRGLLPPIEREEWIVPLPKPGSNGSSGSSKPPEASSAGCLTPFADLTAFLCSAQWPDGSPRGLGTLLVTAGKGKWTLKVKDPNGNRYAFYSANTLDDALAGVDLGLSTDELDWRDEKPFEGQRKK